MSTNPLRLDRLDDLTRARYVLLRTHRRDGTAVDTPIWFAVEVGTVVFRTKIGPKTTRLTARPDVELTPCDHRGRVRASAQTHRGTATILSEGEAAQANRLLQRRYGWQWNVIPLLKVPGVTNVHRDLSLGEKLRRARARDVWPDSVIVRVRLTED
ncbi:PPOX class F420-dependent oxidoreductase [Mycolicibacterium sp. 050158]|uniref:PPOX class F420-dependent oxidoreductase n=1 Tax=Mycolicibacterium sp. 050158 TaxID=3090602 RepID=UPI00299EA1CF|nr:PPOX class F420-dependent oxidoreductase [Mycolicibacterium sp. 050158]MDX1893158.1 PPOX class F420-dependent oxidoreductase [Mycolicibacterium sp. 050158]